MHAITIHDVRSTATLQARLTAALTALLLGGAIVWGVAFAPQAEAHNAAHDGRHVFAFPCH